MKTISHFFKSSRQASKFQQQLYSKYNSVELISFPSFSENGIYKWIVKH